MTELTDRTIAQLRAQHDLLAPRVADLSDEQLAATSGAAEWTVAQVLSHLGSGAEIALQALNAAHAGHPAAGQEFNQGVWARWDALEPRGQAAGFLEHDENLVAAYEALDAGQRDTLTVDLGWLPQPLPITGVTGLRLGETAAHGWDVLVGLDGSAEVDTDAALVMFDQYRGDLAMLLGFIGKPDAIGGRVVLDVAGTGYVLIIDDGVSLGTDGAPTAALEGPAGSALRLLTGRLRPEHAEGIAVTGNVSLDELRQAFPGY